MNSVIETVLISSDDLKTRIRELGQQLTKDYNNKDLVCICILKGAFMFAADLIKHIDLPLSMEFMSVSSYGDETTSSGTVKILLDLKKDIANKHVVIIEDIVDTGLTMKYLINLLTQRNPSSIKVCTLLEKKNHANVVPLDYIGFTIPREAFVIGYGLDYAEKYRNLDHIGIIRKELVGKKPSESINV